MINSFQRRLIIALSLALVAAVGVVSYFVFIKERKASADFAEELSAQGFVESVCGQNKVKSYYKRISSAQLSEYLKKYVESEYPDGRTSIFKIIDPLSNELIAIVNASGKDKSTLFTLDLYNSGVKDISYPEEESAALTLNQANQREILSWKGFINLNSGGHWKKTQEVGLAEGLEAGDNLNLNFLSNSVKCGPEIPSALAL